MTGQGPDLSLKFLDDSVLKILEITTTDGGVFKGHVWNGPSNVGAISVQSQMTCSLCPDDSCGSCHRWYTGTLDATLPPWHTLPDGGSEPNDGGSPVLVHLDY